MYGTGSLVAFAFAYLALRRWVVVVAVRGCGAWALVVSLVGKRKQERKQ